MLHTVAPNASSSSSPAIMTFPALPHGHDANETRTEANFEGGRTATAAIGPQPAGGDVEHECADSTMRPFDCPG